MSLVEYALLLVAICVLAAGGWKLLGKSVKSQVECAANLEGCGSGSGAGRLGGGGGNGSSTGGNGGEGSSGSSGSSSAAGEGSPAATGGTPRAFALTAADSPGGGSFGDQVSGQAPKPIDGTFGQIAADVYHDNSSGPIDGFTRLTDEQLQNAGIDPSSLRDPSSGFRAAIYRDADGNTVLAYAGSQDLKDWKTNFKQGLGFNDSQYNQAVSLAKDAKVAFGDDLVITGHSLGGGLAATGAIATGSPAVTFNASGVNDKTIERLNLDPNAVREQAENGQIRRYAVDGEILTNLQEKNIATKHVMPDAVGHKITLPDPNPLSGVQKWIPGARTKHGIDLHTIGPVNDSMRKYPPW